MSPAVFNVDVPPHHGLERVGVRGGCRVGRVGHELSQVTRAVQRVSVRPFFKRLLAVEKNKLQCDWEFLGKVHKKVMK